MRGTSYIPKDRCWSANSSGVGTVGSSYGSFSGGSSNPLTLSELSIDEMPPPVRETVVADATTRPAGLTPHMLDAVIRLAEHTGAKLVQEAHTTMRVPLKHKNIRMLSVSQGIELYEMLRPHTATLSTTTHTAVLSGREPEPPQLADRKRSKLKSLWNKITRRNKRAKPTGETAFPVQPSPATSSISMPPPTPLLHHVPRLVGVTQVHVELDELLDVVGHRSAHATSLLHPAMVPRGPRHTLLDCVDTHVSLRSMTLRPTMPTANEPRDFLVVEYHHSFQTPSGRRGYAVACHSVHWTRCPSPSEGAVRASMYESGLVAIESEEDPELVDLYCVAELNLKGDAEETENFDASHRRVLGSLARITQTIEERAKMLLSLDHTRVFQKVRRSNLRDQICSGCRNQLPKPSIHSEPYTCRKCYVKVCEDCSSIWQRGHKAMRLCMECWADATLNRTCSSEHDDAYVPYSNSINTDL